MDALTGGLSDSSWKKKHTHSCQVPTEAITSVKNDVKLSKPLKLRQTTVYMNSLYFYTYAYYSEHLSCIHAYISGKKRQQQQKSRISDLFIYLKAWR